MFGRWVSRRRLRRGSGAVGGGLPRSFPCALALSLSIGERDAKLLAVREGLWGPQMEAVVACPEPLLAVGVASVVLFFFFPNRLRLRLFFSL